jgi:hypothetical protein
MYTILLGKIYKFLLNILNSNLEIISKSMFSKLINKIIFLERLKKFILKFHKNLPFLIFINLR